MARLFGAAKNQLSGQRRPWYSSSQPKCSYVAAIHFYHPMFLLRPLGCLSHSQPQRAQIGGAGATNTFNEVRHRAGVTTLLPTRMSSSIRRAVTNSIVFPNP